MKNKINKKIKVWTPKRIEILKKYYSFIDNELLAYYLDVSESAIRNAAIKFKLKKKNRYWLKYQEEWLLKNWDRYSIIELALTLNKSRWAVINKHRELTRKKFEKAMK